MAGKKCANCGKTLDAGEGVGSVPGLPNVLVCRPCYKSMTNPN